MPWVIDGQYLTYRAYCAGGVEAMIKSTIGTMTDLASAGEELWIVWEAPDGTGNRLRRSVLPEYKHRREPKPDEYFSALDRLTPVIRDCGWHQAVPVDGEADDAAMSLCQVFCQAAERVRLWSRDKDWLQLLTLPGVTVFHPPTSGLGQGREVTADDVPGILGVPAERVVAYLALCGDTADDVPGMPRVGARRARDLIAACPGIVDMILAGRGDEAVAQVAGHDAPLAAHAQRCADRSELLETMVRLVQLYPVRVVETRGRLDAGAAEAGLRDLGCGWAVPQALASARDDWGEAADDSAGKLDDWSE